MGRQEVLFLVISIAGTLGFIPHGSIGEKDPTLTEALLREIVERMGKEFNEAAATYLEYPASERQLALMARAGSAQREAPDYDALLARDPSPVLRDQEFLQHSSLWGHQYVSGGAGEGERQAGGPQRPLVKTDAVLPAYCNPPNPCPVGYDEERGCILEFENTAAFSREYQLAQRCMCDGEHMFSCPSEPERRFADRVGTRRPKKYKPDAENPFLQGARLPIAAKKGFQIGVY